MLFHLHTSKTIEKKEGNSWLWGSTEPRVERDFFKVTAEEDSAREELRPKVEALRKTHPFIEPQSEVDLLRLLRARSLNVEKALVLLEECTIEKQNYLPVTYDMVEAVVRKGLAYVSGCDNKGRSIVYVNPEKFRKDLDEVEHIVKFIVFMMDGAIHLSQKNGEEQVLLLFDLSHFSLLNMDYKMIKKMLHVLMSVYPERVAKLIIFNPPYFFSALWTVVKPWLDDNSLNKFHFLRKTADLYNVIDQCNLPTTLGGTFEFNPDTDGKYY